MNTPDPEIYIVDDDNSIRAWLNLFLQSAGYRTKAFASGREFLQQGPPDGPACLLLDVEMPALDGPELQKRLLNLDWCLSIVFISATTSIPVTVEVLKTGAVDFLSKPFDTNLLLKSVAEAVERSRELYLQKAEHEQRHKLLATLTEREREVLSWILTGKLNKQIADTLGITERTVKAHRANLMSKLKVDSVVELVLLADRAGVPKGRE